MVFLSTLLWKPVWKPVSFTWNRFIPESTPKMYVERNGSGTSQDVPTLERATQYYYQVQKILSSFHRYLNVAFIHKPLGYFCSVISSRQNSIYSFSDFDNSQNCCPKPKNRPMRETLNKNFPALFEMTHFFRTSPGRKSRKDASIFKDQQSNRKNNI